jgi:hypothetical protein
MTHTITPEYQGRSNDDLLRIALDAVDLTPEARVALAQELKNRGLDTSHIEKFAIEEKAAQHAQDIDLGRLGLSRRGNGRRLYGKSNLQIVGLCEEYNATLFAVAAYFPFIPMGTYHISKEQNSKQITVLDKQPLNWNQITWIWLRAISIIAISLFAAGLLLRVVR